MLDQIDRLPCSEHQPAFDDRDLQRGCAEHGLDVGRHVIGTFGVVAPSEVLRREMIERGGQILQHRGIGILLNRQRGRGVTNEQRHLALDGARVADEPGDISREIEKAAARGLRREQ